MTSVARSGEGAVPRPTGVVVWDCETSGLDRKKHEILSISASCGDRWFSTFIKPTKPIPPEASRINHIFDRDVADAPPYETATLSFASWILETAGPRPLLVAYNGNMFDLPVLLYHNSFVDSTKFPTFEFIYTADPLECARKIFPREQMPARSFTQASLYAFLFGAAPADQHTSDGDVRALNSILDKSPELRATVMASARELWDISGEHIRAVRERSLAQESQDSINVRKRKTAIGNEL